MNNKLKTIREEKGLLYDFEYIIKYQKIKNTYIQIKDGNVIVKAPKNSSKEYISKLVLNKKEWILKKISEQKMQINKKKGYEQGDYVFVLGKPYVLIISYSKNTRNYIFQDSKNLYCQISNSLKEQIEQNNNDDILKQTVIKKIITDYYKNIAIQEVLAAMEDLKLRTGLSPVECNIKNLKSTWGICSSNKKISINLNLMAYSRHVIEYVCLHEICHLKHMNHSKEFWNMVEKYMPDYKIAKKELKSH